MNRLWSETLEEARFEIFMMVTVKSKISWVVALCSLETSIQTTGNYNEKSVLFLREYSEASIHRFRWGSEKETMDLGKQ
jgi:hypothetical protein